MTPAYRYRAKVRRVIDGDTYVLDIDAGFNVWVQATVRLVGWNCPELREPLGPAAHLAATDLLKGARDVIVETQKGQTFARWLGHVWVDGTELGVKLEAQGLATRA